MDIVVNIDGAVSKGWDMMRNIYKLPAFFSFFFFDSEVTGGGETLYYNSLEMQMFLTVSYEKSLIRSLRCFCLPFYYRSDFLSEADPVENMFFF